MKIIAIATPTTLPNSSPAHSRRRSGITLTEILISILILGVGLVALATLFPLGLLRVESATAYSRSALLAESASGEIQTRDLLNIESFQRAWYGGRNPFVQDTLLDASWPGTGPNNWAIYRGINFALPRPYLPGPGLPIVYDPLWWSQARFSNPANDPTGSAAVFNFSRFGNGQGLVRDATALNAPGCYGIQRITNFAPWVPANLNSYWPLTFPVTDTAGQAAAADIPFDIFVSQDDLIMQTKGEPNAASGRGSTIVPDLSGGSPVYDWKFSWALSGLLTDSGSQTVFDGDVIVFRNREFGFDVQSLPNGVTRLMPAGEQTFEAVFGYSTTLDNTFYGGGDGRVILLRWPSTQPDPNIRVGNWIADTTYERDPARDLANYRTPYADRNGQPALPKYPGQRIHWYQIVRKSSVEAESADTAITSPPNQAGYRRMTVTVNAPVRARTRWVSTTTPLLESALFISSVVNVFPKTLTIK